MGEGSKFFGLSSRFRYCRDESEGSVESTKSLGKMYEFSSGYRIVVDGDGGIYARDYVLNASLDYPELVKLFSYLIKKLYGVDSHTYYISREHCYFVKCYSKKAFLDYIKYPHRISSYNWKVPFEYLNEDTFRLFLRGLLSTDGNISSLGNNKYIRIRISSVNRKELQRIKKLLLDLYGIKSSVYKARPRDSEDNVYTLQIEKNQAIKFLAFIGTSYKAFHNKIIKKFFYRKF